MSSRLRILYAAVAAALTLALIAPALPLSNSATTLFVVLDRSVSMQRYEPSEIKSAITQALDDLPPSSRVALIEFAVAPEITAPPSALSPQVKAAWQQQLDSELSHPVRLAHSTDLERALNSALSTNNQAHTAVLLVSDGIQTHGNASTPLNAAKNAKISVFYLSPNTKTGRDAWLTDLTHTAVGRVGDRININVTAHATVDGDAQIVLLAGAKTVTTQTVRLRADAPLATTLHYVPERAEPTPLKLLVKLPNDVITDNDSIDSILDVLGPPKIVYISQSALSPLALSIGNGGFAVDSARPNKADLPIAASTANTVIVLDDIAADDLAPAAVEAMARAVGERGAGLVVLGGPHAFGNGGYRHSRLEELLPVTSESGLPRPSAAVLFVVDKSGSMESDPTQTSRLALAQRAIAETAKSLAPDDLVGLLAFDVNTHWLLPLSSTADPARAVAAAAANMRANGGTHLRRAVQQGVDALASTTAQPRLLVLVTDGFSENEKLDDLVGLLVEKKIVLIALAVGADAETAPLQPLATASGGNVLRIDDALRLPRIMRQEVDRRRQAAELGRTQPETTSPLPFLSAKPNWPAINGYNIVRTKREASFYLRAPSGDPLLASHYFGAGRVIAFTPGFGPWSTTWPRWEQWPRFSGGLLQWAAGSAEETQFHANLADGSNEIEITAEIIASNATWYSDGSGQARITAPDGTLQTVRLLATAPGRYQAHAAATAPGNYVVSMQIGPYASVRHITHRVPQELANPSVGAAQYRDWEQQQLIKPWSRDALQASLPNATISTRPIFLIFAGLFFLLLIAAQRGWLTELRRIQSIIKQ